MRSVKKMFESCKLRVAKAISWHLMSMGEYGHGERVNMADSVTGKLGMYRFLSLSTSLRKYP